FEIDGAFEWPWAQVAVLAGEADPQQVLVGADLGDRADRRVEANLHHLVALAPERLLVAAVLSRQHRPLRALAQQLEHDRKAVVQRLERCSPGGDVALPGLGMSMLPRVVRRQVELAGTAGDDGTAADAHQPFVLAQVLAALAGDRAEFARRLVDLPEDALERLGGNLRVVAKGHQRLPLALEFL